MNRYFVRGPFEVPVESRAGGRMIAASEINAFWSGIGESADSRGCYVFAIRAGRGTTPIYVGKASKTFRQECFAPHKLSAHYNPILLDYLRGTPVMFLVAQEARRGKPNMSEIDELEDYVIGMALRANPDLSNIKGTKQENWGIVGVVRGGQGKPSESASQFKRMLAMDGAPPAARNGRTIQAEFSTLEEPPKADEQEGVALENLATPTPEKQN